MVDTTTATITARPRGLSVSRWRRSRCSARERAPATRALSLAEPPGISKTIERRPGCSRSGAATAHLNRHQPGGDLAQTHRDERDGPGCRADPVRDAEAADRGLGAVAEREDEHHPRADPGDQEA